MPSGCHWGAEASTKISMNVNTNTNNNPTTNIHMNGMRLGCHWDGIGNRLGCHWETTRMQRRVLSNLVINIDMSINLNIDRNTDRTVHIHFSKMPSGCHWGAETSTPLYSCEYEHINISPSISIHN